MTLPCDKTQAIDRIECKLDEVREDIGDIKGDLREHMARTKANEDRIEIMEDFAKTALETQQKNFNAMLKSNKDNQEALNKQLKLALTVLGGIAALVTAILTGYAALH